MIIVVLLLWVGGALYFIRDTIFPSVRITQKISAADRGGGERLNLRREAVTAEAPGVSGDAVSGVRDDKHASDAAARFSERKQVTGGWVTIIDPWGGQVARFRAITAGDGWLALPARACLGGNSWYYDPDIGREAGISGGLWINGDEVGLWQVAENSEIPDSPDLGPWNQGEPVSWSSLESDTEYQSVKLIPGIEQGFFLSTSLPDDINEIGVFMQGGRVVGWSFGGWLDKGYMWPGNPDTSMAYKTWVRYFYNMTFTGGREEKFAEALAMEKGHAGLDQLSALIEGFQLEPKLAEEDTPYYLLPEEIIERVLVLVAYAVGHGEGSRVVDMLNSEVLRRIGDITLLMNTVPAIADSRGLDAAIREIEGSGRYITGQMGVDVPALNRMHLQLYQDWLRSLVSVKALDEGFKTYNAARVYYPDDPYIHLLGVELALLDGDWEEAELQLYAGNYPPDLQNHYELLARRIEDMKGQEGKIVIRFPRGSNKIPVTADINGSLYQDFLLDTGASLVTIPSSTADELGLEIVHPQRPLKTAGGTVTASEVIIDRIEIDGWVEYDIRAYVLDMPGQPGLGLLGLNYLGRFRMDLNADEGTLLLTPR